MNTIKSTHWTETLPEPLPLDPLMIAADWLAQATIDAAQPNPNAMVLASVDEHGRPSARVVLCKGIDPGGTCIKFFTNYESRKGRELAANGRAAVVFHWDHRHRQVRAEGHVDPMSGAENDEYFSSRAWQSRIGAWASKQSEPVATRDALVRAVALQARRFGPESLGGNIPRPPNWGGFRLQVEAIELWVEGEFRIHDRARWTRTQNAEANGPAWSVTRLQP